MRHINNDNRYSMGGEKILIYVIALTIGTRVKNLSEYDERKN
jgi:hypothetical protein